MINNLITKKRKEFLGLNAPTGYVAGMGRGATGFTTRSDIGPARDDTDVPDERHMQHKRPREDEDNENLNDTNYDEFTGYSGNLCSKDPYDEDDVEADKIYESIDAHMDERRRMYRERREQEEMEKYRKKRPKIQQDFVDVKRELNTMSMADWANIPEVGDARNRRQRLGKAELYAPKPDSLIRKEFEDRDGVGVRLRTGGAMSTFGTDTVGIDMQMIGRAKKQLMEGRLNQVADSVGGQTVVDPKGYLTDLQSMMPRVEGADISDVSKSRMLLKSVIESNPHKIEGWLGIARLEEACKNYHDAKKYINEGCQRRPDSEELWLEAVRIMRLHGGSNNMVLAQGVVAKALKFVPSSVSLWVAAASLETSTKNKKIVYRKAVNAIPDSVRLWRDLVELEETPSGAKSQLEGAVKCCVTSVAMWLALARLCEPNEARAVLNSARQAVPTDRQIWIAGCKLEEAEGKEDKVELLMNRAIEILKANRVEINRDEWMRDAELAEQSGSVITARKIIQCVVALGVEEQDCKHTWMADAELCEEHGCVECARAIYSVAIQRLVAKKSVWRKAALFEKRHGSRDQYESVLSRAVDACRNCEQLWLMLAKSKWDSGDVESARVVLSRAFVDNPNSEEVMLAAVKLESENNEFTRAKRLLEKARLKVATSRVWIKSARLHWCLDELEEAVSILSEGVSRFGDCAKLWMMLGQVREQQGDSVLALQAYKDGTTHNPANVALWILQSGLEERLGEVGRAQNTLEKAKAKNITVDELWLALVRLLQRSGNTSHANGMMARALQHCPASGVLWAESVDMVAKKSQRQMRAGDALKKCENDEHVMLSAAKVFWVHAKVDKARNWFKKALKSEPLLGDAWAYLYKLETIYGTAADRDDVIQRCVDTEPRYGQYWAPISKDVKNWRLKTRDLLPMVADKIPVPL